MTRWTVPKELADQLVGEVPSLRAFARSLTVDDALADDLVQETILKAWAKLESFTPGTNLRAWLFTILRNTFLTNLAKTRRVIEDAKGHYSARVVQAPAQSIIPNMVDFKRAFDRLPATQREALMLVGAIGFSYEEAAGICGAPPGTIKSRVNRGRQALAEMLELEPGDLADIEPETLSVLAASRVTV